MRLLDSNKRQNAPDHVEHGECIRSLAVPWYLGKLNSHILLYHSLRQFIFMRDLPASLYPDRSISTVRGIGELSLTWHMRKKALKVAVRL